MVDLGSAGVRLSSDLLVGPLGARVANMIMTPKMFARLAAVSSGVQSTASSIFAWEGLEIHLEQRKVCFGVLARMMAIWRRADVIYLDYPGAASLDDHCRLIWAVDPFADHDRRCPIAAVWRFPEVEMSFESERWGPDSDEETGFENGNASFLHLSSVAFPADHWVFFNMEFPAHSMPCFDVGWMCDDHDIWTHLCFRVSPQGVPIESPDSDRARWYAGRAMTTDPAIRVPSSWTSHMPWSRLRIGLTFTSDTMCLSINHRHWRAEIEPPIREAWSRRARRPTILVMSDVNPDDSHPRIEAVPWYLIGGPMRRLTL